MFESEGARRLIALGAVIAGVGAQTFITSGVDAYPRVSDQTYGVRLLGSELAAPVSLDGPAAAPSAVPGPAAPTSKAVLPEPRWLEVDSNRYLLRAPNEWPERRDASGTIIQLSENDVLIPTRLPYP